jgi:DNA-binding response OmpR family regulator
VRLSPVRVPCSRGELTYSEAPDADGSPACDHGGSLQIHRPHHRVQIHGRDGLVTPTAFALLWTLTRAPGKVVSWDVFLDEVCMRGGRRPRSETDGLQVFP